MKELPDTGPIVANLPDDAGQPENPRLYPSRNVMHRNMGPPQDYPCCGGRGYFPGGSEDSPNDSYCDCRAGRERQRTDP